MTDKALEQEATTAAHLFYGRDATYGKEKAGYAAGYIAGRTASSNEESAMKEKASISSQMETVADFCEIHGIPPKNLIDVFLQAAQQFNLKH